MKKQLRRFNEEGLNEFKLCIAKISAGIADNVSSILERDEWTEIISEDAIVEVRGFADRLDAAQHLDSIVQTLSASSDEIRSDIGLWSWLSACWWDIFLKENKGLVRNENCYVLNPAWNKYYRHYLCGAWSTFDIHRDNPDRAKAVLCTPPHKPGEIVETFCSRRLLITNKSLMQTATDLYYDRKNKVIKSGSASRDAGSADRLAAITKQFQLTYALREMEPEEIWELLPSEFDRYKR